MLIFNVVENKRLPGDLQGSRLDRLHFKMMMMMVMVVVNGDDDPDDDNDSLFFPIYAGLH